MVYRVVNVPCGKLQLLIEFDIDVWFGFDAPMSSGFLIEVSGLHCITLCDVVTSFYIFFKFCDVM